LRASHAKQPAISHSGHGLARRVPIRAAHSLLHATGQAVGLVAARSSASGGNRRDRRGFGGGWAMSADLAAECAPHSIESCLEPKRAEQPRPGPACADSRRAQPTAHAGTGRGALSRLVIGERVGPWMPSKTRGWVGRARRRRGGARRALDRGPPRVRGRRARAAPHGEET